MNLKKEKGKLSRKVFCVFAVMCVLCLMVGCAAAADTEHTHKSISEIIRDKISNWTGWTFDLSEYQRLSEQWKQDVKNKIRPYITERSKSFEDRAKAQAYALGWDDRFDYVEKYGTIDYDTGTITYDIPFWDSIFGGLKFRERWFTNVADYDAAMTVYMDNYTCAVQPVPQEV